MPEPEPKCKRCIWLRYIDLSPYTAYCCGNPDSPCMSNVTNERHADTAPAWCPLRKEKGE